MIQHGHSDMYLLFAFLTDLTDLSNLTDLTDVTFLKLSLTAVFQYQIPSDSHYPQRLVSGVWSTLFSS